MNSLLHTVAAYSLITFPRNQRPVLVSAARRLHLFCSGCNLYARL